MSGQHTDLPAHVETTCGSLLHQLQKVWDDVGEPEIQRDKMLLQIEQECLGVYREKIDEAKKCRAQLLNMIAVSRAELAEICYAMGEEPRSFGGKGGIISLKKDLHIIMAQLEDMRKRKFERKNQFVEVLDQLQEISKECGRHTEENQYIIVLDETDLSMRRLEELRGQLLQCQNEKRDRLKKVLALLNTLNSRCLVLGMDFKHIVKEIHPTLEDLREIKDFGDHIIEALAAAIENLREVKIKRCQKLQSLAASLLELWNLMDTPPQEQRIFLDVISTLSLSEPEITEPDMLSTDFLNHVETEVSRLEQLKLSRMKYILLKKSLELEAVCRRTHMITEAISEMEFSIEAMVSGAADPTCLLEHIELQLAKSKEEALSRKEILEKVGKWMEACHEESWLEEYNRDENRYNAGKGSHLTLKRAEKARARVNKIPAMVGALTLKITAWEEKGGIEFLYDGDRLLSKLEQYSILRQEKEQKNQRQRDHKKFRGQVIAEQQAAFGSKPSPLKSAKKGSRILTGVASNRSLSIGRSTFLSSKPGKASPCLHPKDDFLIRINSTQQKHDGFKAPASAHKHSSSAAVARDMDSPIREPLSPILSGKSQECKQRIQKGELQRALSTSNEKTPRSKQIIVDDKENRTPTMPISVATTPSTVPIHMLTAGTPATPEKSSIHPIEYSFEEEMSASFHKARN